MADSGKAILALDLGVNLGACGGCEEIPSLLEGAALAWVTRTRQSKGEKIKETRPWGVRWRSARNALTDLLWEVRPAHVVVEGPGSFRSQAAYRVHYGLHAMVQELALDFGAAWEEVSSTALKKWATGKGNAKKPAMIAAAEALEGPKPENDHQADARLLYALARERILS